MASESKAHNIRVAVRVRPLTSRERQRGSWTTVDVIDSQNVLVNDPDDKMGGIDYLRLDKTKSKRYCFDHAFGAEATNADIYEKTARALARKVVEGYNACCFAYGATGAGKTFTMMGSLDVAGVIPLTLDDVFAFMEENKEETNFKVSMQYTEIYNEKIKDLLNPSDAQLDVREVASKGTYVAGATEKHVTKPAQMLTLMHEGNLFRTTEATKVNQVSSRSHAVLQVKVCSSPRFSDGPGRMGKLSMIDLAGSERATKTENRGIRLMEGRNINSSLLALGNCINALADKSKKTSHVPFRDSKLTRLLKDSLGGNCLTTMITNCSPAQDQFDETLNSLKYANRAKNIKPRDGLPIVVNERTNEPLLSQLKELQAEVLAQAKSSEQVTPAPASRLRRTKPSPQKRIVQKRGLYEGQAEVERDEGDEGDEGDEEENKRGPNRRTGSKGSRNTRSAPTYGAGGGGASAKGKETINAECDESHHPEGGACDAPCPLRRKSTGGVRSTAMAPRKLGAMGATSGVTQPAALQMYQMLDNMELEECDTFKESAHALLKELAGLLDDFYSVTQQMFKVRSSMMSGASKGAKQEGTELAELEEGRDAQRQALAGNQDSLRTLIIELPMRIISAERQEHTRLILQNVSGVVMQLEREMQLQTLRRLLTPASELHPSLLPELLCACSGEVGGGRELFDLAGGRLPVLKHEEDPDSPTRVDGCKHGEHMPLSKLCADDALAGPVVPSLACANASLAGSQKSCTAVSLAAVVPTLMEAEAAGEGMTEQDLRSARSSFLRNMSRVGDIVYQATESARMETESARIESSARLSSSLSHKLDGWVEETEAEANPLSRMGSEVRSRLDDSSAVITRVLRRCLRCIDQSSCTCSTLDLHLHLTIWTTTYTRSKHKTRAHRSSLNLRLPQPQHASSQVLQADRSIPPPSKAPSAADSYGQPKACASKAAASLPADRSAGFEHSLPPPSDSAAFSASSTSLALPPSDSLALPPPPDSLAHPLERSLPPSSLNADSWMASSNAPPSCIPPAKRSPRSVVSNDTSAAQPPMIYGHGPSFPPPMHSSSITPGVLASRSPPTSAPTSPVPDRASAMLARIADDFEAMSAVTRSRAQPAKSVAKVWPESECSLELTPVQLASVAMERAGFVNSSSVGAASALVNSSVQSPSVSLLTKGTVERESNKSAKSKGDYDAVYSQSLDGGQKYDKGKQRKGT